MLFKESLERFWAFIIAGLDNRFYTGVGQLFIDCVVGVHQRRLAAIFDGHGKNCIRITDVCNHEILVAAARANGKTAGLISGDSACWLILCYSFEGDQICSGVGTGRVIQRRHYLGFI